MTLEEARLLLGDEATTMSDEQIEQLIYDMDFIAKGSIKMAVKELVNAQSKTKQHPEQ